MCLFQTVLCGVSAYNQSLHYHILAQHELVILKHFSLVSVALYIKKMMQLFSKSSLELAEARRTMVMLY